MWLNAWAHRSGQERWEEFRRRYYEFRPEDVVRICRNHHAEIHSIYDKIIQDDTAKLQRPLYKYTWAQGHRLMQKLEIACSQWLTQETPGIDSQVYSETKRLRISLLKKEAKRRRKRR